MEFMREPQLKAQWIEQFVVLCQEQDISQAALKLGVSRQTLQRNTQLLEKTVRVKLIERSGKNFYITPEGRLFLSEAEQIVARIYQLSSNFKKQLPGTLQGTVSLAWQSAHCLDFLPRCLSQFMGEHPSVYVRIQTYLQLPLIEQLLHTHELDMALVDYPPVDTGLLVGSGRHTPYVIVSCPQNQRHWSSFSYVYTEQNQPAHVAPPWNDELYPRQIVARTNTLNAVLHWAAAGVAAFVPQMTVQRYLNSGQLAIVAQPPEETFKQFYLCLAPKAEDNEAAQMLVQQLRQIL